jgi:hypothetical protein
VGDEYPGATVLGIDRTSFLFPVALYLPAFDNRKSPDIFQTRFSCSQLLRSDLKSLLTILSVSPIQPAWVPPNVKFMVDDYESRWLHGKDYFDFIHGRHVAPITKNLPQTLSEAYR